MFLCLCLCRSICCRLHCIPLFCFLFCLMLMLMLMLMPLVWTRLKHKINTKTKHVFSSGTRRQNNESFSLFRLLFSSWLMIGLWYKPGSHEQHKHKHKINMKTKHDFSSGTWEDKTTRIFLCSALGLCLDYRVNQALRDVKNRGDPNDQCWEWALSQFGV